MAANFLFFSHHFVSFPTDLVFYKALMIRLALVSSCASLFEILHS